MSFSRATADFMKKVPSVYTHSMGTIHLSLSALVAEGTVFRKCQVPYSISLALGSRKKVPMVIKPEGGGGKASMAQPLRPYHFAVSLSIIYVHLNSTADFI